MNISCQLALKECLPCDDDPIRNLSAEDPDVDVFIGWSVGDPNPPPHIFAGLGCKTVCFSTISQDDADDCARSQAIECLNNVPIPPNPPIPPGPGGPPGGGGGNPPGGIPPGDGAHPVTTFRNTQQCCETQCPSGQEFSFCVEAGTVADYFSVALANAKALALACKRSNYNKLCFVNTPTSGCVGEGYEFPFSVVGGTKFTSSQGSGYIWNFFGDLPPGLTFDGDTGVLSGTPTEPGVYTFDIDVFDAAGGFNTNVFTICVADIPNDAELPAAIQGTPYSESLTFLPAELTGAVWTVVSGELPPGITLATDGTLSGTPTAVTPEHEGPYSFTIQVVAACFSSTITCSRSFSLEVLTCLVDEIFDLVWNPMVSFGAGTFSFIDGGNGAFNVNAAPSGPFDSAGITASTTLTNPNAFACDIEIIFGYTQTSPTGLPNFPVTQPLITFNAVLIFAPDDCCPDSPIQPAFSLFRGQGGVLYRLILSVLPGANTIDMSLGYQTEAGQGGNMTGTLIIQPSTGS